MLRGEQVRPLGGGKGLGRIIIDFNFAEHRMHLEPVYPMLNCRAATKLSVVADYVSAAFCF